VSFRRKLERAKGERKSERKRKRTGKITGRLKLKGISHQIRFTLNDINEGLLKTYNA
jgi:polyisoprenoid-binding protein YceI